MKIIEKKISQTLKKMMTVKDNEMNSVTSDDENNTEIVIIQFENPITQA